METINPTTMTHLLALPHDQFSLPTTYLLAAVAAWFLGRTMPLLRLLLNRSLRLTIRWGNKVAACLEVGPPSPPAP